MPRPGTLPASLGNLKLLTYLNMAMNWLSGTCAREPPSCPRALLGLRDAACILDKVSTRAEKMLAWCFASGQWCMVHTGRDVMLHGRYKIPNPDPAPTGTVPPEWGGMVNLKRVQIQDLPLVYGALSTAWVRGSQPYTLLFSLSGLAASGARSPLRLKPDVAAVLCSLHDGMLTHALPRTEACLLSDVTLACRQHPRELVVSKAGGLPLPEQQHVWCAPWVVMGCHFFGGVGIHNRQVTAIVCNVCVGIEDRGWLTQVSSSRG